MMIVFIKKQQAIPIILSLSLSSLLPIIIIMAIMADVVVAVVVDAATSSAATSSTSLLPSMDEDVVRRRRMEIDDKLSRYIFDRFEISLQEESIAVTDLFAKEQPKKKLSKLQLLSSSRFQHDGSFNNNNNIYPSESGDDNEEEGEEGGTGGSTRRKQRRQRRELQSDPPSDVVEPILIGLSTNFVCDKPSSRSSENSIYSGRSLCRYSESPYPQYNNVLGCYCLEINDLLLNNIDKSSKDCECVIVFWTNTYLDLIFCRSVSIIVGSTTNNNDNNDDPVMNNDDGTSFQLQYDCSNVFEEIIDDDSEQEETCVGRDQYGTCFDINTVPSPISSDAIVTGRYDELTCLQEPISEDSNLVPELYVGKYQCNSPINPPPGFPYPRTDSYVGLLCNTPEPNAEQCDDCFVSITHPPDISNHCNACELVPTSTDDTLTYQISFDCTNFYTKGDCVGVDQTGNCLGGKNCQGIGNAEFNCQNLFQLQTCIVQDDDDDDDSSSFSFTDGDDPCNTDCIDKCESVHQDCNCIYGLSIGLFGEPTGRVACSGTADIVCNNFVSEDTCENRPDFNCEWVPN